VVFWCLFRVAWLASTYVTPDQGLNQVFNQVPEALVREHGIGDEEIARAKVLFEARSIFGALAGLWGWVALYAGAALINRAYQRAPLAIRAGLIAGILAVAAIPGAGLTLASYPVATSALLFAIWWLNPVGEKTGTI
jgi:hypothetical protein